MPGLWQQLASDLADLPASEASHARCARWYESCCLQGVSLNVRPWALVGVLALSACSAGRDPGSGDLDAGGTGGSDAGGELTGEVQLGVPGGPDGLDFSPLEDGAV